MVNLTAYIDPATTTIIWQILAGVLIVFGVVLGIWWTKITTFFKSVWAKIFGKKKNGGEQTKETDEALDEISDDKPADENTLAETSNEEALAESASEKID